MGKRIETTKGLLKLLERFRAKPSTEEARYWISTILGCIREGLAMDEVDYENTSSEYRPLWNGLK